METTIVKFRRSTKLFSIYNRLSLNKSFNRDFSDNLPIVVIDLKNKTLITTDDESNTIETNVKNTLITNTLKTLGKVISKNENSIILDKNIYKLN